MAYDRFGAPVKSTEVALAYPLGAVQSEELPPYPEPQPMNAATHQPASSQSAARLASTSLRDAAAAAGALADELAHAELGCVLFFCSADYDLAQLGPALEAAFPGVLVCGCTTAGEITPQGYGRGCMTAIALDRRHFAVDCALIQELEGFSLQDAQACIDRLLATCRDADLAPVRDHTFAITLLDGLSSREELVLATLNAALGSIPQFGGSAGDDERLNDTHVYFRGRFHNHAAIVMLVNTPLDFRVFSTHHMTATEQKLVVTRADSDRRTVHELNAEPAARAYARAVGVTEAELDRKTFALHPMAVRIGGHHFIRSVQRVNADGSLTFYCAVETGIVMTMMRTGSLQQSLQDQLEQAEAVVGQPLVTIGCDCFLRRLEAEVTGIDQNIGEFLSRHRVMGFNSYGEQFDGMHINQTFTGVVIGQPDFATRNA
ncbi:nitric oxide-sensing protein NosP [Marinobacter sp. CA1]|uniref:nitric oxide-sensing protein NosP n=1 Tax=Marinobacter sp. CA1 TaxID=2817656 RepID=UPI001D065CE2|nr:nitric oxide-sensing protein NosP [Marinobacter sp. CA1]UDL04499.1 FIST C-terminal domain-containing protein [Marinobacter sp. CA1]